MLMLRSKSILNEYFCSFFQYFGQNAIVFSSRCKGCCSFSSLVFIGWFIMVECWHHLAVAVHGSRLLPPLLLAGKSGWWHFLSSANFLHFLHCARWKREKWKTLQFFSFFASKILGNAFLKITQPRDASTFFWVDCTDLWYYIEWEELFGICAVNCRWKIFCSRQFNHITKMIKYKKNEFCPISLKNQHRV